MQLQWVGTITTDLPLTRAQIARWLVQDRSEVVRRFCTAHEAPSVEQVEAFMDLQPHFAQLVAGLYAREHGLLPPGAELRVSRA